MPGVGIQGPEQASQLIGRQSHISLTPYRELFDRVSSGEWVGAAPEDGGSKWLVKGRFVQGVTWAPAAGPVAASNTEVSLPVSSSGAVP